MAVWDELRVALSTLQADPRHPLRGFPDPRADVGRSPPFAVHLAPWAVAEAEGLHESFGDAVRLTVGHLAYPDPGPPPALGLLSGRRAAPADPSLLGARLVEALVVRSGHDARSALSIHNRSAAALQVITNGQLTAMIIDPRSGALVGTFDGAQRMPLVRFPVEPGHSVAVPLLVGTASLVPTLGYAVPPGRWALDAELDTNRGRWRTAALPFTVT